MKILCSFLLMAGFVVCRGQGVAPQPIDFQRNFWRAPVVTFGRMDSVRVVRPDRMLCWVPDMTKVEPMPVKRVYNGDRMVVRMGKK